MIRGTAAVVLLTLVLASCSGCQRLNSPAPIQKPTQSAAQKMSASEALTAAKAVYLSYLKISDRVSERGGKGVDELSPYVSAAALTRERASAAYLQERGLRISGTSTLLKFQAQRTGVAVGRVTAYACVDFKRTKVLNKAGKDLTPSDRADRQTSVASFAWSAGHFVLNENKPWSGKSIC